MDLKELTRNYDFSGRTIAITGGAGVLGGEIACALVGVGANVAIIDHDPALAEPLMKRLECGPGCATVVYGDVLEYETLVQADQVIRSEFGPVDTLINAAGGNRAKATTSREHTFFDLDLEDLEAVVRLNLLGTLLSCQALGYDMVELGKGVILNVSSMNAFRPLTRIPAYSAAKAGVSNFTQWLAVHMAQEYFPNIRVNAIAPGFFLTKQNSYLLIDERTGEYTPRGWRILDHTPAGRFGDPQDLLGVVMWLLSDLASFVTGVVIPIDGGFSAYSGV